MNILWWYVLSSHRSPTKPGTHWQLKPPLPSEVQDAPFKQGFGVHASPTYERSNFLILIIMETKDAKMLLYNMFTYHSFHLRLSQRDPKNPIGHEHRKPPFPFIGVHVPPLEQGLLWHASIASHRAPLYPGGHTQRKPPLSRMQVPWFKQGWETHGSTE